VHYLRLDLIRDTPPRADYTVDIYYPVPGAGVGSVTILPAGRFEVIAIDVGAGTATIQRDAFPPFTLLVGETETW